MTSDSTRTFCADQALLIQKLLSQLKRPVPLTPSRTYAPETHANWDGHRIIHTYSLSFLQFLSFSLFAEEYGKINVSNSLTQSLVFLFLDPMQRFNHQLYYSFSFLFPFPSNFSVSDTFATMHGIATHNTQIPLPFKVSCFTNREVVDLKKKEFFFEGQNRSKMDQKTGVQKKPAVIFMH